jgi:hypothetical protein
VEAMPKYLVEIILVVGAKDSDEARKIADYIIDLPIPDKEIENKMESLRREENGQIANQKPSKFWPTVRQLIWEKGQQLYQEEQARIMGADHKGVTATRKELREAGNFHTAKLIILRNPAPPKETLACKTQFREYCDKDGKHSFTLKLQKGKGYIKA